MRKFPRNIAMMKAQTLEKLNALIQDYATNLGGMEQAAKKAVEEEGRAEGGILRATKGKILEVLTEKLVQIAWKTELEKDLGRLVINKKKISIFLKDKEEYALTICTQSVRDFIIKDKNTFCHKLSVDKHMEVDGKLIFAIECKAFAENKMMKGILADFQLLKTKAPNLLCYLFQLESQLGGDYSSVIKTPMGSPATHAIMSHFPKVNLRIVTLLSGDRKVKTPIHEPEHFKPLTIERLEAAVESIVDGFRECKVA